MRLLVINFEMDRLSRTMPWSQQVVNLLAKECETVVVLTSRAGQYTPPPNVLVKIIPARPFGIPRRFGSTWLLNFWVCNLIRRSRIDVCFIHMAMEWAYYLKPCFKLLRIPVLMWYAHGTVSNMLKKAHNAATRVVTSTPEGCRIKSDKIFVIGQGIDTSIFDIQPQGQNRQDIITVTRISPRKRIELLIEIMRVLKNIHGIPEFHLKIIGTPITTDDQFYEIELRDRAWRMDLHDYVEFVGFVPQEYIPVYYRNAFLHINVSQTGSMDKTVLESLACGCPVLTSNEAFFQLLAEYPEMVIKNESPRAIARQILDIYERRDSYDPSQLRNLVVGKHDIHSYVGKIMDHLRHISTS